MANPFRGLSAVPHASRTRLYTFGREDKTLESLKSMITVTSMGPHLLRFMYIRVEHTMDTHVALYGVTFPRPIRTIVALTQTEMLLLWVKNSCTLFVWTLSITRLGMCSTTRQIRERKCNLVVFPNAVYIGFGSHRYTQEYLNSRSFQFVTVTSTLPTM